MRRTRSKPAVRAAMKPSSIRPAVDRDVQQPVGERRVGAGRDLQVQRGELAVGDPPRIDDDERAAALALLPRNTA